jgi:hypothetical protein
MMITEPGIYALSEAQYHADPCAVPSLTRTIAGIICEKSPAHAYVAHPRLGGDAPSASSTNADLGTAFHAAALRGENRVAVLEFDDFKSGAAKAAREAARAAGKVPLLGKDADRLQGMLRSFTRYRDATGAFTDGEPERTVVWQEGDVWCRCCVDWLPNDAALSLLDLKSTSVGANLDTWSRAAWSACCDIQSNFYNRGVGAIRGEVPLRGMAFVVVENTPPYAVKTFGMTPESEEIGTARTRYAMDVWGACMEQSTWPGYDDVVEFVEPPYRIRSRWEHLTSATGGDRATITAKRRELVAAVLKSRSLSA